MAQKQQTLKHNPFSMALCGAPVYDGNNRTKQQHAQRLNEGRNRAAAAGSMLNLPKAPVDPWQEELKRLGLC